MYLCSCVNLASYSLSLRGISFSILSVALDNRIPQKQHFASSYSKPWEILPAFFLNSSHFHVNKPAQWQEESDPGVPITHPESELSVGHMNGVILGYPTPN